MKQQLWQQVIAHVECRRTDFKNFKNCWVIGNPEYSFNNKTKISAIDEVMHNERIDQKCQKVMFMTKAAQLPDGVFIVHKEKPYLIYNGSGFLWTPNGYKDQISLPKIPVHVLTPKSVVNAIRSGYCPQLSIG